MGSRVYFFWAFVAASLAFAELLATNLPTKDDPRLQPVFASDRIWTGVAITPAGRTFVTFPGTDKSGAEIKELDVEGQGTPYPDAAWNSWKPGADITNRFVHVNAVRTGPAGALWILDAGAPAPGKTAVRGGARVFKFDLATNTPMRVYSLTGAVTAQSFVDDIRFNGRKAYLTDTGAPALIVLDLDSGAVRRVLQNDRSISDKRPLYADGKLLRSKGGKPMRVYADQLEVSPDGRYLYFQPASGPLARVETRYLDDPKLPPAALSSHVERNWVDTPTTGGTAIDAHGTIYLSDTNHRRILTISPRGKVATLIADPRLVWGDAMWIDARGFLWIPATQLNLTPAFAAGREKVRYPVAIYKMYIGAQPPARDHS